ncbi:MAG: ASKHA domain-containing protein [Anaerolineales bacterium]|nr:ASKHA domain-containing protein [Anaerolineales bacterium]
MIEFRVDFQPVGRRSVIRPGQTLLEAAQVAGVGLASVCGGIGTCEQCRVQVLTGSLSAPTPTEEAALGAEALAEGWRLACQATVLSDVRLHIPPESLTAPQRLQLEGLDMHVTPDPFVRAPGAYGIAVDIGTTKLAGYLVHLESGETVARAGAMNPQIVYGEDVVSRIAYAGRSPESAQRLQAVLMKALNDLLEQMCAEAHILPERVLDAVLVGNTAMHHLALGLPVEQLGHVPFAPVTTEPLTLPAASLGLTLGPGAQVYFPPVIAGYVGSDHLALLLTIDQMDCSTCLALDIGTNTEIALLAGGRILCCSCASGPAFEGAHIQEGMRAAPGAVERVRWSEGKFLWQTIGNQPPVGLCGSGILDAVAALLDAGLVRTNGQLLCGDEVTLIPAAQSGVGRNLVVTRRDIHEIQLAKAAVRSGVETLLRHAGLAAAELGRLIVAGAFGTYLDVRSAMRVGMFPSLPMEKVHQVGNAAGIGAKQMLLSVTKRRQAERLAQQLGYIELATDKGFMEMFIRHLNLA